MRKTIVLSIDVLIAAIMLAGFLIILEYYYEEPVFDNKQLHSYAKNTLSLMDESLASKNALLIAEDVDNNIPLEYLSYQLRIKYYDEDNDLINEMTLGSELPQDYVVVNREFIHDNGFGAANMRLWLGKGGNQTIISMPFDLWELVVDKPLPVDFTNGLNSTSNTFGPLAPNDGWDWDYDIYGSTSTCYYWNNDTVDSDEELRISIGDVNNECSNDGEGDAAYGIKFYINSSIVQSSSINISFDWSIDDNGLDNNDDVWIKSRFGNGDLMNYLGTQNGYANDDSTPEVVYDPNPNDDSGTFTQDVSSLVDGEGWYYLDFGCKVRDWDNNEWVVCGFDNINVEWN